MPGTTTLCICQVPPPWVHQPPTMQATVAYHQAGRDRLTALTRVLAEVTVRVETLTVAHVTVTRFTVGQEFSVCQFLLFLPKSGGSCCADCSSLLYPFHGWRMFRSSTFLTVRDRSWGYSLGSGHLRHSPVSLSEDGKEAKTRDREYHSYSLF